MKAIAFVALTVIQLPILRDHLPKIVAAIDAAVPGNFQLVDCGSFTRRRKSLD